ncbi:PfkB family carbohydrate kinase [Kitasatospora sp. NPDC008115]|uniref:PfkB family carbohydrate kinase n=1 Tax=Kitasatospora sp. NPDC008115 TaxID=3364022 RepID=UPI0036E09B7A
MIGGCVADVVRTGDGAPDTVHPGGSPANVAYGPARLGEPVALLTEPADDPYGRLIRAHLESAGVLPAAPACPVVLSGAPVVGRFPHRCRAGRSPAAARRPAAGGPPGTADPRPRPPCGRPSVRRAVPREPPTVGRPRRGGRAVVDGARVTAVAFGPAGCRCAVEVRSCSRGPPPPRATTRAPPDRDGRAGPRPAARCRVRRAGGCRAGAAVGIAVRGGVGAGADGIRRRGCPGGGSAGCRSRRCGRCRRCR